MTQSIAVKNMLTRKGYTPYCGADSCIFFMPRTVFTSGQYQCVCGWRSQLDKDIVDQIIELNKEQP